MSTRQFIAGQSTSNQPSILTSHFVEFGPAELLARFFLRAEHEARSQGVHLSFANCADMVAANELNKINWLPLLPLFNPKFAALNPENSFCILGRNGNGDVVSANAGRLYEWHQTDIVEEAQSLRLYYDDANRMKLPNESCTVTARLALQVSGRVAYVGAAWVHPNFRGRGLSETLPRIAKALAFTKWKPNWITSLMTESTHSKGLAEKFAYNHADWEVLWRNGPLGDLRCAILWMDMPHLVSDLDQYLVRCESQVETRFLAGRA